MSSPEDVINEEGDRFINDYLDVDTIASSENPYQEFLRQMESEFGIKRGLNLWNKVFNKYGLLNKLFKNKLIQDKLPKRVPLKKKEVKSFFEKYDDSFKKKQDKKEIKVLKNINIPTYYRRGKKISSYTKSYHMYSNRQERFIMTRKDYPLNRLAYEFNEVFKEKFSKYGLRDKRLRLLGKKKWKYEMM